MTKPVVVGNGMLAKAFSSEVQGNYLYFCSGVSNSQETSRAEFAREKKTLMAALNEFSGKIVVYFSSIIAEDGGTPYAKHKRDMEAIIENSKKDYLIIRLPQVVGITRNNTIVSFFVRQIKHESQVTIQSGATRNLIDIDDVRRVVNVLLGRKDLNRKILVGSKYNISALEIVDQISSILGVVARKNIIDGGECTVVNTEVIEGYLHENDPLFSVDYPGIVLQKYVKIIAAQRHN